MGSPAHQLHDDVRRAAGGRAAVEHARNIAMIEAGQDLPLGLEALLRVFVADVGAHELDGDFRAVLVVVAHRLEYLAHATGAEYIHDPIRADALTDAARVLRGFEGLRFEFRRHSIEKATRLLV